MDLLHRHALRAPPPSSTASALLAVRYVLPATLLVAGVVLWAAGGSGAVATVGGALVGVALTILVVNLFVRLAFSSQIDRDHEDAARRQRGDELARRGHR